MAAPSEEFLASTEIIDWQHVSVRRLAEQLASGAADEAETAKRCFEWVRDQIRHSGDYQLNPVTCAASEVLEHGTGYCYAKSHLLAALLRANGIAAGFCYQRLSIDDKGPPFCLHGLNAVYLPEVGWPLSGGPRGGIVKGSVLSFAHQTNGWRLYPTLPGEEDLPGIHAEPLPRTQCCGFAGV